ncbi:hypothetical protein GGR57DRAFT_271883 [Xylariaceae sp. FL1272]|nr:hypothetical protein GGR57DRAFT_271883 [Xylariaceae sp. FL1272]
MTNLGPLTTTFTPRGADCASTFLGQNADNKWLQYGASPTTLSACYPDGFNADQFYYFSPGTCPFGYATACQALSTWVGTSAENYVTCCPSSYICNSRTTLGDPFPCKSEFRGGTSLALSVFSFDEDSPASRPDISSGTTTIVFSDPAVFETIYAYGVVIQPTAAGSESTLSETPSTGAIPTSPQSTSPAPSGTGINQESSSGLSKAAAIGVGVGVGLAAIGIGIATYFVLSHQRRRRSVQQPQAEPLQEENIHTPKPRTTPFELDAGR